MSDPSIELFKAAHDLLPLEKADFYQNSVILSNRYILGLLVNVAGQMSFAGKWYHIVKDILLIPQE